MKRTNKHYIDDILESISLIESYISNSTEDSFSQDNLKQDAVLRRIQIIGEAAKRVSEDFKKTNNHIQWKEIAGMRDRIVHDYQVIDLSLVWDVVKNELPKLQDLILQIEKF